MWVDMPAWGGQCPVMEHEPALRGKVAALESSGIPGDSLDGFAMRVLGA